MTTPGVGAPDASGAGDIAHVGARTRLQLRRDLGHELPVRVGEVRSWKVWPPAGVKAERPDTARGSFRTVEAEVERHNYTHHRSIPHDQAGFVVVHYRRQHNISQSYVTTTLEEYLRQLGVA